jgi:hypothetical protein
MTKRKANAKHSKLNKSGAQHNMSAGPHRFAKGMKKLGGRKKGTRNKLTSICREDLATRPRFLRSTSSHRKPTAIFTGLRAPADRGEHPRAPGGCRGKLSGRYRALEKLS